MVLYKIIDVNNKCCLGWSLFQMLSLLIIWTSGRLCQKPYGLKADQTKRSSSVSLVPYVQGQNQVLCVWLLVPK